MLLFFNNAILTEARYIYIEDFTLHAEMFLSYYVYFKYIPMFNSGN